MAYGHINEVCAPRRGLVSQTVDSVSYGNGDSHRALLSGRALASHLVPCGADCSRT